MSKKLTLLGVHGLGDHRASDWQKKWPAAIQSAFPQMDGLELDYKFVTYDDIFANTNLSFADYVLAVTKLTKSGLLSLGRRERGVFSDLSERLRWTAGYVVAWVEKENFQRQTRKRILDAVREHQPDVILAHSLGSLITYNAFSHPDAKKADLVPLLAKAKYVTFGSQIGNPFVIGNLTAGRIARLDVDFWYHLYNENDDVFTAPIKMPGVDNFEQTDTPFDDEGFADHNAESYFKHRATIENVWRPIGADAVGAKLFSTAQALRSRKLTVKAQNSRQKRKALLIGINNYPIEAQRLQGCVNDVFTMSALLQDCGMDPASIRTCLDERATTEGILSRIKWLLDDPQPGDELVLYYSGHGAQVPEYADDFEPDHRVETLVPWDFDWSREKMISDDQIYHLYSQLPYDCRLVLIFDCCHSGSMHRDGGPLKRGISPPDDIRHRDLKWDSRAQMWVQRDFKRFTDNFGNKRLAADYFGHDGATRRLGRAGMVRNLKAAQYAALKRQKKNAPYGPYLPMIIEACGESEFSYEYRHGAESHGAFTFTLNKILREHKGAITFEKLVQKTRLQLEELQYKQIPQILGPSVIVKHKVPWIVK